MINHNKSNLLKLADISDHNKLNFYDLHILQYQSHLNNKI